MQHKAPRVREHMTRLPVEVENCDTLGEAADVIEKLGIKHVPVLKGSDLVGIVTARDVLEAQSTSKDWRELSLASVATHDVATVSPVATIVEAARLMLERGIGSVVVTDGGFVVGIFTKSDALRVILDQFH